MGSLSELYLDDILIPCYSLPQSTSGLPGLLGGANAGAFAALSAWAIPPTKVA
jgi:hypothetical protein